LGLGRLHETFRFISITGSRTVGRTPWTGDQLVARPLLTAPGDCDDDEVGGMNGFGRGNRSPRRNPTPTPLCPPQIHCHTWARTRAAAVGSQCLTASALPPEKQPAVPTGDRAPGGHQRLCEKRKQFLGFPGQSQVPILTELSRLLK
jgi:hypothetical protein